MSNVTVGRFGVSPLNSTDTPTGGDGGSGDVLEPRVAKLEAHVEHIQRDVAEIKTSLGKVSSDVGEIKITLAEIKAKQETFATKADLEKAIHGQTKWLIISIFAIVAGIGTVMRLLPPPESTPVTQTAPTQSQPSETGTSGTQAPEAEK